MERHVRVLAILIGLGGLLALLVGVSLLLLAAGAAVVMADSAGPAVGFAAGLTAGSFAVLGTFTLLWGGAHVRAGTLLRRRHATGRILTLALATVDLLLLPFGTALGIYAIWVLLTHEGRRMFAP
jgi:hypothetical protein